MGGNSDGGKRHRVTYANAMSTLAVVLALAGGTAIAAVKLSPNSVSSKTVKNNSLTSTDLANGKGVKAADVADGSLSGADLADGSVSGADAMAGSLTGSDLAAGSVGSAALGKGAVGKAALAPGAIGSEAVADGSLAFSDVGTDTVTSKQLQASTLGTVGDAAELSASGVSDLTSRDFLLGPPTVRETAIEKGVSVGGGIGFTIEKGCEANEVLLAGGPANLAASSTLWEDGPSGGKWVVSVESHPIRTIDEFSVVVLCAKVAG